MRVGVNPIAWVNGDFPELGAETPYTRCLEEIRAAGYAGTELGHGFPEDAGALRAALDAHGLELISAWYPSYVLGRTLEEEERAFGELVRRVAACGGRHVVVAELTRSVQRQRRTPLRFRDGPSVLSRAEWDRLGTGLERLAAIASRRGVELAYHPHVGTVVQEMDQVHELVARTSERVRLTADTGHVRFAGDDPGAFFEAFRDRIALVHLKDVRTAVIERVVRGSASFYDAVLAGVFTVPGDGDLDFTATFAALARSGYGGWIVVEAEQDPRRADPLAYATKGREAVRAALGV